MKTTWYNNKLVYYLVGNNIYEETYSQVKSKLTLFWAPLGRPTTLRYSALLRNHGYVIFLTLKGVIQIKISEFEETEIYGLKIDSSNLQDV